MICITLKAKKSSCFNVKLKNGNGKWKIIMLKHSDVMAKQ